MTLDSLLARSEPEPNTGCWLWTDAMTGVEYGSVRVAGRALSAHVLVVTLGGRTIPPGWEVDHRCGQRLCINPDHLDVVSPRENKVRAAARRREVEVCVNGHPYTDENTHWYAFRKFCRPCNRAAGARRRAKNADV